MSERFHRLSFSVTSGRSQFAIPALVLLVWPGLTLGQPIRIQEAFPVNYQYRVSSRVDLNGTLTSPGNGSPAKAIRIKGHSIVEYDERVLAATQEGVAKTARIYRRLELKRKVGEREEESTLRKPVRRLVLLRWKNIEVPFSPDGPLQWGEIELIRTDVFSPALAGLLPQQAVQPGTGWQAKQAALQELTDMEKIESGSLTCRLDRVTTSSNRRYALVTFTGSLRGVNEDGPTRQVLKGYYYFDMESNHLSYLSLEGTHILLGKDGKEAGRIEGRYVMTRQPHPSVPELTDAALRGVSLEPNDTNTLLLYENPDLGLRFHYPRHWHVSSVRGRQLTIDEKRGSGLLVTVEPISRVPTGQQFLAEVKGYFQSQKATIVRAYGPRTLKAGVEYFSLEVDLNKRRDVMDYYIIKQPNGGLVVAARLVSAHANEARKDVQRILQSLVVTRAIR